MTGNIEEPIQIFATQEDVAKIIGDLHIQVYLSGKRIAELERENRELKEKIRQHEQGKSE